MSLTTILSVIVWPLRLCQHKLPRRVEECGAENGLTVSPVSGTRSQQWCSGDLVLEIETMRAGNLSVSLMLSWYLELGLTKLHLTTPGPGRPLGNVKVILHLSRPVQCPVEEPLQQTNHHHHIGINRGAGASEVFLMREI